MRWESFPSLFRLGQFWHKYPEGEIFLGASRNMRRWCHRIILKYSTWKKPSRTAVGIFYFAVSARICLGEYLLNSLQNRYIGILGAIITLTGKSIPYSAIEINSERFQSIPAQSKYISVSYIYYLLELMNFAYCANLAVSPVDGKIRWIDFENDMDGQVL